MEKPTFIYNPDLPIYDAANFGKPILFYTWVLVVLNLLFLMIIVFNLFSSEDKSAVYVIQGILFALLLLNLYLVNKKRNTYQTFIKNAQKTNGNIVGKNVAEGGEDSDNRFYLFYQFDPAFTMRVQLKLNKLYSPHQIVDYYNQFKEGDKVEVYHKPANPQENIPILEEYKNYRLF